VNLEDNIYTLIVQDFAGGAPVVLGEYESVMGLSWSLDGQHLILSSGPYDAQQVYEISTSDGSNRVFTQGREPSVTTP
jgi:Tol biopolymer transport system component